MSYLDQITVGSNTYELKSSSIPSGTIANTSTSTVFTATVNGVYSLYDGVRAFLRNETVTSASGCTLNINNLGAKPIYDAKTNSAITNNFKINTSATFIYNSTQISGGCWLLDGSENEVYYGTVAPTDPNVKFWIDPSGTADSIPQPATNTPQDLGVANVGSSTKYARQDHVHNMPSASDVGAVATSALLDLVYPVGSLYWSSQSTDPGTLFGGTWTPVKDTFILAAGDTYAAGATGGAATVTLTEAQLPAIEGQANFLAGRGTSAGTRTNLVNSRSGKFTTGDYGSTTHSVTEIDGASANKLKPYYLKFSFGSGNAHNNMPPYKVYYCWERTA